ncbi:MAG TPA: VCBS repeat-containing protein [Sinorhizobium sp.]|nr:VCBS repeat-containing protein [Sinorhizobium sp.]
MRSFGLAFADMDRDGRMDIISGPFWYRQPAAPWAEKWEQIRLGEGLDAVAALDLDQDGRAEVIAQRGGGETLQFLWLKAIDASAHEFEEYVIGEVPAASHDLGSQGRALAQIVEGGHPEVAVSSGGGVFYFEIPDDPAATPWPRTRICAEASDEGIAFADLDGDGLLDLAATTGDAKEVAWWRNPGAGSQDWVRRDVAKVREMVYPDRVAAADLNGDGRPDIVVSEENGEADGAMAYWWRNPGGGSPDWEQHEITSRGSLNSLSVADIDGNGRLDLVMAEHRGALRLSIWQNMGGGRFIEQLVGEGFESHLGAYAIDLDGDGALDIVSIAWDAPGEIHAWRNGSSVTPIR